MGDGGVLVGSGMDCGKLGGPHVRVHVNLREEGWNDCYMNVQ